MNEVAKYNYDVVTITSNEIAQYGYIQPNESVLISISDDMKTDIEQMRNRDTIIRSFIINPDIGFCLGFNFEGKDFKRGQTFWATRVFYYNPNKAWIQSIKKGGK